MPNKKSLEAIVESIDKLPAFPEVARRVLELSREEDAEFKDIIDVIKYDEAITANCLRLCNSSYYGLRVKIFSIDQAVVMLGLKNIIMIALANSKALSGYKKAQEGYGYSTGELWKHSVTSAIISQLLIKKVDIKEDSVLFTATLLHDIGKIALNNYLDKSTDNLIEFAQKEKLSLIEAEREVFGIDHAELGTLIAESWGFPSLLIRSIKNHHKKSEKLIPNIESWVKLSNQVFYVYLANSVYSYRQEIVSDIKESILIQFGLGKEHIDQIKAELPAELRKVEGLLKLTI